MIVAFAFMFTAIDFCSSLNLFVCNSSKMGSGGSFSVVHDELIISGADIGNGVNLTTFSNQTSQGEGGGAQPGYPDDHHSDEHSNPVADSLSFCGTESNYQIFTGKRISLASQHTFLLFIVCLPESARLTWIYLSIGLSVCAFGMVSESGNHHSDQRGSASTAALSSGGAETDYQTSARKSIRSSTT
eukprot:SAG11_NODE_330_length_10677_cov_8.535117_3_plen_187_part_00